MCDHDSFAVITTLLHECILATSLVTGGGRHIKKEGLLCIVTKACKKKYQAQCAQQQTLLAIRLHEMIFLQHFILPPDTISVR